MELTKEYVLERLLLAHSKEKSAHFKMIDELKKEHKKLRMHVHGIDVGDYIVKLESLENDSKIKLRKRLSRSNKDLFSDVLRPTDKIYSKQGGSKVYKFLTEANEKKFKVKLSTIYKGQSFMRWLKSYFIDKFVIDPNGVFLVEHNGDDAYPTYKSILSICDYMQDGLSLDYIIFEPKQITSKDLEIDGITEDMINNPNKKKVRVYDSKADYTFIFDAEQKTISDPVETFVNPWGAVPGVLCSDREDTITGFKQTPIYEQIELADEHLRINSVNTLQYYHHGFAKFWKHGTPCKKCDGMGVIAIKNGGGGLAGYEQCGACRGKKTKEKEDVSDITYISIPKEGGKGIAPDVMGYITPPIESLKQLDEKVKEMRDMIYHSHWGTVINRDEKDKTAFEVSVNTQPMQDRLNGYTDALENIEEALTNYIGQYYYKDNYKGCSISYGRNYVIKSSEDLFKEYQDAKSKGASYTILNEKLAKYYSSLYSNDTMMLDISLKLMQVEPFVHDTLTDALNYRVTPETTNMVDQKLNYNDWRSSIDQNELIKLSVEQLKESLNNFTNERRQQNVPSMEGNRPPGGRENGRDNNNGEDSEMGRPEREEGQSTAQGKNN